VPCDPWIYFAAERHRGLLYEAWGRKPPLGTSSWMPNIRHPAEERKYRVEQHRQSYGTHLTRVLVR
jgi:hypothetical protein